MRLGALIMLATAALAVSASPTARIRATVPSCSIPLPGDWSTTAATIAATETVERPAREG